MSLNLGLLTVGGYFLGKLIETTYHIKNMTVTGVLIGLFLGFFELFRIAFKAGTKMTFLLLLIVVVVGSLSGLLGWQIHGYAGAVILGVNTILLDLLWQWLRVKILRKNKTSYLVGGVLGGLVVRVISVFSLIQLALWWLGKMSSYFLVFGITLLTIPLWSLLAARKFKLEKN